MDDVCSYKRLDNWLNSRVVTAVVVVGQRPWLRISGNCYSTRQDQYILYNQFLSQARSFKSSIWKKSKQDQLTFQGGLHQAERCCAHLSLRGEVIFFFKQPKDDDLEQIHFDMFIVWQSAELKQRLLTSMFASNRKSLKNCLHFAFLSSIFLSPTRSYNFQ